jgi:hypothetical protein
MEKRKIGFTRALYYPFLAVCIAFSGCAVINEHERVPGWPDLKVVEHHVAHEEMRERCAPFMPAYMSPEGCTIFQLDVGEAHIYVSKDFPNRLVLEHERLHAAGYDHIGSDHMQRILGRWKARQRAARL